MADDGAADPAGGTAPADVAPAQDLGLADVEEDDHVASALDAAADDPDATAEIVELDDLDDGWTDAADAATSIGDEPEGDDPAAGVSDDLDGHLAGDLDGDVDGELAGDLDGDLEVEEGRPAAFLASFDIAEPRDLVTTATLEFLAAGEWDDGD